MERSRVDIAVGDVPGEANGMKAKAKKRKSGLETRNAGLLAVPIVGTVMLAVMLTGSYYLARMSLFRTGSANGDSIPVEAEEHLEALLRGALADVLDLVSVSDADGERRGFEDMERLAAASQFFTDLTLYDSLGEIVFSTSADAESAEPYEQIFKDVLAGSPVLSSFDDDSPPGQAQSVQLFIPVIGESGSPHQVMVGTVPLDRIGKVVDSAGSIEDFSSAFMRAYGHLLVEAEGKGRGTAGAEDHVGAAEAGEADVARGGYFFAMGELDAAGTTEAVTSDVFRRASSLIAWTSAITFGLATSMLAFISVVFYRANRRLHIPLQKTASAARDIAKGDLHVTVSDEGPEEIGHIAQAFNHLLAELRYHRHTFSKMVKSRTRKLESAQKHLEKNVAHLRASYDSSRDAVLLVDAAHENIVETNQQLVRLFGIETNQAGTFTLEAFRKAVESRFGDGAEFERCWTHYQGKPGEAGREEWRLSAPVETILEVYTSPVKQTGGTDYIGRLWTFRDVTEQRHLEEKLRQAQKIDTIEHIAASFAHDFNNLLTIILGNLSISRAELSPDNKVGENLKEAEEATTQATALVRQLLGFSERSRMKVEQVQLNAVLAQIVNLVDDTTPPHIVVKLVLRDDLWLTPADKEQMKQVLLNLCMNAVDAMPTGGTLAVRTDNVILQKGDATLPPNGQAGDYVRVTIKDTGTGMPAHVRERVFEPFFTTKSEHGAQGLGLSMAESVITKHGGWIGCASKPDEGAEFCVYLQRSVKRSEDMTTPETVRNTRSSPPLVLIVDDEAGVRRIAASVLARFSVESLEAADGEEALEIYRERMHDVSVVLLDMSMPKLSGRDTFVALKGMNPDVQVLLCSGYPVDLGEFQEITGHRPQGTVQKPFDMAGLAQAVREVISAQSQSTTA